MRRFCSIWFLLLFAAGCSTTTPVKLVGLVQSSKTDDNDNPVDIFLWDGKTGFPIDDNENKSQLLEKVDSKIEADGEVTESGGKKTLTIKKYRVLREASE